MLINDVKNKDEICSLIINELKDLGIKYRKDKRSKTTQEKRCRKRIFHIPLHLLELTDVFLANGGIVQVPQFVSDACQRILEQVETEGLFRKAGSAIRQKEIKTNLEAGLPLGRSHHVIDVANVLKSFFRELPEALLPHCIQEPLLRGLLCGAERINAILMTCLLLPPLTINTLAFFMQFLNTVSLSSHLNKMCTENLAIIFTPGLMPLSDIVGIRFNNHVKVVQLLIEHAEMIGILPDKIIKKMELSFATPLKEIEKKKKKRRSGSLTRMFNGLRKIVGAIGSAENLDNTFESSQATPCLTKSAKKRKNSDACAFSAKKRKELLSLLPENGGLLPDTPSCAKDVKKNRLSLGGRKNLKFISSTNLSTSMERRWSVVGSGWARKKQNIDLRKETSKHLSPVISMPCIVQSDEKGEMEIKMTTENKSNQYDERNSENDDYVRIHKSEYEAIKERVSAIETRISQEFGNVNNSLLFSSLDNGNLSGPERVLNQFEKTIEETENISSTSTDHLAKRLSRELKIRRSDSNKTIRSPSARKIGSIRRRSKENIRLSRNKTWHISDTKSTSILNDQEFINREAFYPRSNLKRGRPNTLQTGLHQPVSIDKEQCSDIKTENIKELQIQENWTAGELFFNTHRKLSESLNEGLNFSNLITSSPDIKIQSSIFQDNTSPATPQMTKCNTNFVTIIQVNNEAKTPMLPPRSAPRKNTVQKTPVLASKPTAKCIVTINNKTAQTPGQETQTGRASIARLRSQNAGMVMAKAKLFDGLGNDEANKVPKVTIGSKNRNRSTVPKNVESENRPKTISDKKVIKVHRHKSIESGQRTPRRKNPPKSPICLNRRQKGSTPKNNVKRSSSNFSTNDQGKTFKNTIKSPHKRTLNNATESSARNTPKSKRLDKINSSERSAKLSHANTFSFKSSPRIDPNIGKNSPRLRYHSESINF